MTTWKAFLFGDNGARAQNEKEREMRLLFIGVAAVLFIVAIIFANCILITPRLPDLVSGLSSLGFSLAGGMSLLAAAIVKESENSNRS